MAGLFSKFGIHERLLSVALLLVTSATFTLGYFGVGIINTFVQSRFNQRMDFMTKYLAMNSELGILIDERNLLESLAQGMLEENDVTGVEIENSQGKTLVSLIKNMPGPYKVSQNAVMLSQSQEGRSVDGLLDGMSIRPEQVGVVRVTYSTAGIKDLVREMRNRFIVVALVLTFLSWVIFYYISRSIVSPVVALAETARKFSMGQKSVRAVGDTTPEIRRLADAFNEMLDSIEKSRKTLIQAYEKIARQEVLAEMGKFSMMIAHEVKNPLAIIKSSLEMLKLDLKISDDNLPLSYAEEEIVRLNDLIESFLMFARPAKPNFEVTDLNQLVYQVVAGFEIRYSTGELSIETHIPDTPFEAEADFDLLSRGISNIITNACEACRGKGSVRIAVDCRARKWTLKVEDRGPGIPEAELEKIFEPFHTTKATGTGLGLAFANQVITAHGGRVTAENMDRGGARFCIILFSDLYHREEEVL